MFRGLIASQSALLAPNDTNPRWKGRESGNKSLICLEKSKGNQKG
jgi:hypothetical protein